MANLDSIQAYAGSSVIVAVACAALVHSRPSSAPGGLRTIAGMATQEFYVAAAEAEVQARKKSEGRFRGSPWSQDDDFHNKEAKFIRAYGKSHKLPMGSLVDALDRGTREHWPLPAGVAPDLKVLPCRPRLNY